jgi:hypothetical protein
MGRRALSDRMLISTMCERMWIPTQLANGKKYPLGRHCVFTALQIILGHAKPESALTPTRSRFDVGLEDD